MENRELGLTFSVKNNPGVYTLLIGSGVSSEAGVPTGWGSLQDLIKQIAQVEDESVDGAPIAWYRDYYDEEPRYDDVVEVLAGSQEERRSLLNDYFEPTAEEREQDIKIPTAAHESIAWLVREGYVNVIVTTNFDRLLEEALEDHGVNPIVISTPAAAEGAVPLPHQNALVVKVNGDYREQNLKNTETELAEYDPAMRGLLDEIFRQYGLIVCGWSGTWDTALRESLLSCQTQRYSAFWAYHGELEEAASELVNHLDGEAIQIDGATQFFTDLMHNVQALDDRESGAPLTGKIARERVKRHMAHPEEKIRLADLLSEEAERVRSGVYDEDEFGLPLDVTDENVERRLRRYEGITETFVIAASTCAYWGPEVANPATGHLSSAVRRIGSPPHKTGTYKQIWKDLWYYPATYAIYGMGVAAAASGNWKLVRLVLVDTKLQTGRSTERMALMTTHPWKIGSRFHRNACSYLKGQLKEQLREPLRDIVPADSDYERHFTRFELISDFVLTDVAERLHDRGYHYPETLYWGDAIEGALEEIEEQREEWPPFQAGLFEGSPDRFEELVEEGGNFYI